MMKNTITQTIALVTVMSSLVFVGCETTGPNTDKGIASGAILGGIAGAIIGNQSGEPEDGAIIGAATGAALGGMIGQSQDKREAQEQARVREQEAIIRKAETERDIARGYNVTDQEVLEAEQRAIAAENELRRKQKERAEAIERQRRIEEAEARTRAAQAEANALKTY
ncbi:MAG: glycine zipper domain-containing protein [Opitutales bacterium]